MRSLFLCVTLLISFGELISQDDGNYFPLNSTDERIYVGINGWEATYRTSNLYRFGGLDYRIAQHPGSPFDTLRTSDDGNIKARNQGIDFLLYDFNAPNGSSYHLPDSVDSGWGYEIFVTKNVVVEVPAGRFDNCIVLEFRCGCRDGSFTLSFAPDIGIVHSIGGWGEVAELSYAKLNGVVVTAQSNEIPLPMSSTIYPNPASTLINLSTNTETSLGRLSIVDSMGRRLPNQSAQNCRQSTCLTQWSIENLSPGLYFIRSDSELTLVGNFTIVR